METSIPRPNRKTSYLGQTVPPDLISLPKEDHTSGVVIEEKNSNPQMKPIGNVMKEALHYL